jgi:hypothetical protein
MTILGFVSRATGAGALAAVLVTTAGVGPAGANVALTRVSSDPFTNTTRQLATEA